MLGTKIIIPDKPNKNPLKGLFNYQWIVKNIPFFLFLSALTVLYIANGHRADKTIRKINSTTNDLKELQFEYKTLKSEVMFKSQEIQIDLHIRCGSWFTSDRGFRAALSVKSNRW